MSTFSRGLALFLTLCLLGFRRGRAFTSCCKSRRVSSILLASNQDEPDDSSIPQLPAIGESSFDLKTSANLQQPLDVDEKKAVAFVSDKFELQYTCKLCDTRNAYRVSRLGEY